MVEVSDDAAAANGATPAVSRNAAAGALNGVKAAERTGLFTAASLHRLGVAERS